MWIAFHTFNWLNMVYLIIKIKLKYLTCVVVDPSVDPPDWIEFLTVKIDYLLTKWSLLNMWINFSSCMCMTSRSMIIGRRKVFLGSQCLNTNCGGCQGSLFSQANKWVICYEWESYMGKCCITEIVLYPWFIPVLDMVLMVTNLAGWILEGKSSEQCVRLAGVRTSLWSQAY